MVTQEALRGYVLEEFIARLVKDSGYDLLVHHSQDPFALTTKSNELNILGRGAPHQVDVLGQLRTQIPLTYPLRLFIEVKFRNGKTGLATLRNALGVLNDVNEHYSWRAANDASSTARYDYRYAIFSTSGFTNDAIQYAVTQRLSLGDLSTPAFRWLRDAADSTTTAILKLASKNKQGTFRVRQVRIALRRAFATMPPGLPPFRFKDGLPQTELRKSRTMQPRGSTTSCTSASRPTALSLCFSSRTNLRTRTPFSTNRSWTASRNVRSRWHGVGLASGS
ncbi:hypothetical protein [Kribbella sp. NPDC050470]|uniref:hypothetical protein n=1 Tax=unclassified Kribbella TaxID=2644121 RepID=UPI003797E6A9